MVTELIIAGICFVANPPKDQLTIACWNVQNLFDTYRDSGHSGEYVYSKEDFEQILAKKIRVLRFLNADIVGFSEVENRGLVRTLCDRTKRDLRYRYSMLVEETDPRGIDVALISRIPFTAYSFATPGHTRGLLACRFSWNGDPFYVLVNHWKSRYGGGAEIRRACAERVVQITQKLIPEYEGKPVPILVMGDLNDNDNDPSVRLLESNGLNNLLKRAAPDQRWTYSWYDRDNDKVLYNSFDHILANRSATDRKGIDVVADSARVARPEFLFRNRKINNRNYLWVDGSFGDYLGHSDHLPVIVKIKNF